MKEITVEELKSMMDNNEDFVLIDVREPHEVEICTLNAKLIPLNTVPQNLDAFVKDKKVVVHCRSGARSGNAVNYVEQQTGQDNLYNLAGGILAWADRIDPDMEKY